MPSYAEKISFEKNLYFFVVLKPKFNEDNRKFYIHMIKPVHDFNQITKHSSDVILSHLIRTQN